MRIIQLTAENFKRLTAVDIKPDGNIVVVSGKNGQGKTSVLDAIWLALGGGPAAKSTKRPVRDGADKASVTLDLDDIVVTRTWKDDKTTLTVTSKDGARYGTPQSMLDGLIGRLSFDPLTFAQQDEKTQLKTLLDLVELPFDPDDLEAERRRVFERRTEVNRTAKQLQTQMGGMTDTGAGAPDDEVSAQEVLESIRNAEEWQQRSRALYTNAANMRSTIESLEQQLVAARSGLDGIERQISELPKPLPDPAVYTEQLDQLETVNRRVRLKQEHARIHAAWQSTTDEADKLTQQLEAIDKQRADAIENAVMPIRGLGFEENGVTYLGVPFKQASSAEQLRVSVAMAMALNPQVRVIRITDGSLLDSDNMAIIQDMAERHDFQCWIERVDESGQVGVVIEDGMVKA